jgi:hypothetical protein
MIDPQPPKRFTIERRIMPRGIVALRSKFFACWERGSNEHARNTTQLVDERASFSRSATFVDPCVNSVE